MRKFILFTIVMIFFVSSAFADTIKLKNGQEISGSIVERANKFLKIDYKGAKLIYFFDDIETINGEKVVKPTVVKIEPRILNVSMEEKNVNQNNTVTYQKQQENINNEDEITKNKEIALESARVSRVKDEKQMNEAKIKIINILIFVLVVSIFSSFCLFTISNKTQKGKAYFAWIPIANLFLMCDIGEVKYQWIWIVLAAFIPLIGGLILLGFSGFLWYKIALVRNKPGWIGALTCVPLFGLIALGYLTFQD